MALTSDDHQAVIAEAPITDLLIDVADGLPWEDLPERKAAWDEIKRRDAALASLTQQLQDKDDALRAALDCKGSFNGTVSRLGGEPAICTKCEATVRAALAAAGTGEA